MPEDRMTFSKAILDLESGAGENPRPGQLAATKPMVADFTNSRRRIIRLGVVNGATWTPPREGNLGRRVLQSSQSG